MSVIIRQFFSFFPIKIPMLNSGHRSMGASLLRENKLEMIRELFFLSEGSIISPVTAFVCVEMLSFFLESELGTYNLLRICRQFICRSLILEKRKIYNVWTNIGHAQSLEMTYHGELGTLSSYFFLWEL